MISLNVFITGLNSIFEAVLVVMLFMFVYSSFIIWMLVLRVPFLPAGASRCLCLAILVAIVGSPVFRSVDSVESRGPTDRQT